MSCSNCTCTTAVDVDPVDKLAEKVESLERNLKTATFLIDKLREQILDVNRFLFDKYPTDLVDSAGVQVTCSYWTYHKDMSAAEARRVEEMLSELRNKGYNIVKIEPPSEPTLEASIRDVVLANTIIK